MGVYAFTITSPEAGEIKIGQDDDSVQSVAVYMDTLDDNEKEKASAMLARVVIKGDITLDNSNELTKIFEWSKDFNRATTFRKIKIEVKTLKDDMPRIYELDQVFVCDYSECGASSEISSDGKSSYRYELKLTQRFNKWDGVKIY